MNYSELGKAYTSSNNASWFQNYDLEGYQVPSILTASDFNSFIQNQKENATDQNSNRQQSFLKGIKFDKAEKKDLFIDRKNTPGPTYYFKTASASSQNQIKAKVRESSFFKNYPRFQKKPVKNLQQIGISPPDLKDTSKHRTIGTAQVIGFIDTASLKGTWTPGPGAYDPKIIRHKSLSHFSKCQKNSFLNNNQKNMRVIGSKGIGPQSYLISRSLSLVCGVKYQQPLRQSDSKIKEGISRVNVEREKKTKAGPGKYLKIQQWCKYKDSKKLVNGLDVCSKPVNQLKIYN